jgi:hypothetical protein
MAIDTAEKRHSIFGLSGSAQISHRVDLASGVNAADRRHVLESYRGIAAASPGGGTPLIALERSTFRFIFAALFRRIN